MSASRLFFLLGVSIVRNHNKPTNTFTPFSPIRFTKPLLSPVVRFRRYNCTSATRETNTIEPVINTRNHPWPEWVAFVDRLKSKGYFTGSKSEDGDGSLYTDMTLLKDACLNFSRDRSDIFKKLSTQDMQTVVEKGCPNLFWKVVNSGKRLRMHVNLDEGEAEHCLLAESLWRYLQKKLLSELIELSETPFDPEHPRPAPEASPKKKQSLRSRKDGQEDVRMKRGHSIGLEGDNEYSNADMTQGDWICSQCDFMNFSRNAQCLRCKAEGPCQDARVSKVQEMKNGDWTCPQCAFMNFASNTKCLRCPELRPKRQLNPGEWECPSCDFLNYRRNMICKKCDCECPRDAKKQSKYEQQLWTKPY